MVHINAGVRGLIFALILGKRKGLRKTAMPPSSVAFTALGASKLWFSWFGFNIGSDLSADVPEQACFCQQIHRPP